MSHNKYNGNKTSSKSGDPSQHMNLYERLFAGILDSNEIKWQYEKASFPLEWHFIEKDGKSVRVVTSALTPDFYIPESGTYVELTAMKQSLITKKRKKTRKFHELYPDIKIRLYDRSDLLEFFSQKYPVRVRKYQQYVTQLNAA